MAAANLASPLAEARVPKLGDSPILNCFPVSPLYSSKPQFNFEAPSQKSKCGGGFPEIHRLGWKSRYPLRDCCILVLLPDAEILIGRIIRNV